MSILHRLVGAFILTPAMHLLTTDEAAAYLRLSERKLYELIASGEIPCTKITGRWLFPRAALDQWVRASVAVPAGLAPANAAPPILAGSHDHLLEWALRESGCSLAILDDSSEGGLQRMLAGQAIAAAVRFHHLDNEQDEHTNKLNVVRAAGFQDYAVVAFCRRQQGLVVAPGNPLGLSDLNSVATKHARLAQRPPSADTQLLLVAMLTRAQLHRENINLVKAPFASGLEIAEAIRAGLVDCGLATNFVARTAGLGFLPLIWERLDLAFHLRSYFLPEPQALLKFMHGPRLRERAAQLGGYDVSQAGNVLT